MNYKYSMYNVTRIDLIAAPAGLAGALRRVPPWAQALLTREAAQVELRVLRYDEV